MFISENGRKYKKNLARDRDRMSNTPKLNDPRFETASKRHLDFVAEIQVGGAGAAISSRRSFAIF